VNRWRHLAAILLLPGVVIVAIPALILWRNGARLGPLAVAGLPLIAAGLLLMIPTIRLFASAGRGTLAPWDPTTRLVVCGPYRYVRNPMISGVLAILVGEAALFASPRLLVWFGAVFALNASTFRSSKNAASKPASARSTGRTKPTSLAGCREFGRGAEETATEGRILVYPWARTKPSSSGGPFAPSRTTRACATA
jgi:hypothetical protein